ncbi:MAG TPA: imidazole glycerol phosphate synthase subunit HisH [Cyclobacteriaceae bacterium]|nr:imidazole glycerol phosphate synthase subunit HisH [Cyclobacteriaceae bacterium]
MSVVIIDYGMCNLGSVKRAFEECGASTLISNDPRDAELATHLVLPGVGSFGDAMKNIVDLGWDKAIKKNVLDSKVPILGICLGMQLLADKGLEGGQHIGLGLIEGDVIKLHSERPDDKLKIPHIGWNEIHKENDHKLFGEINEATDFYFVHSYFFKAKNQDNILAKTHYGLDFPSVIGSGKVLGVQFHPEKSSRPGFQLIRNFLTIN